jgi:hypothetical protein
VAKDLDAGRAIPGNVVDGSKGFVRFLCALIAALGHDTMGTVSGWAKNRNLRRRYGARTVRDASRTALLQENPNLAERVEAEMQRRQVRGVRRRGTSGALRLVGWFLRLLPIASIAATTALAAAALWP